jgi:P-type E1-E2 ATPase
VRERRVVTACGVEARDVDGRRVALGSPRWLAPPLDDERDHGDVRVALVREGRVLARFRIGEEVRPEAKATLEALATMGIGAAMLTGDSDAGARAIAEPLGLAAHAGLSPEQKLHVLAKLGPKAAMVGDGVNDAPALAAIGPSFATEGGAGLARGIARVTLLKDDLRLVPSTLALARCAMRIGWQNLWASTIYNVFFLALAATGSLRPVWAGVSMLGSSLLTLASSLRVNAVTIGAPDTPEVAA